LLVVVGFGVALYVPEEPPDVLEEVLAALILSRSPEVSRSVET
jgi:hypothetical protein